LVKTRIFKKSLKTTVYLHHEVETVHDQIYIDSLSLSFIFILL